jgi:hypothetical protein
VLASFALIYALRGDDVLVAGTSTRSSSSSCWA